ncbi:ECF transporter S component [Lachnobacterium bovis]|uniref:ECF transporter S component n=1 Tax=Lachnobacterium bovis TaxID=140626 RepID=UPI000A832C70|nr:ECF transporter S component [Lachnobacterium bovis]
MDNMLQNGSRIANQPKENSKKVLTLVQTALMMGIIVVMAFTPLGYINLPGLSITFLTVPVAIAAIIIGPTAGFLCGLTFGLTSFSMGLMGSSPFSTALLNLNFVGFFVTTIVTRSLVGLFTGLIFRLLCKLKINKNIKVAIACLSCPLLNTLLFMSSLVIFYYNTNYVQGFVKAGHFANPFAFVIGFVGIQGAIEAGVCTVFATAISLVLKQVLKK